MKDCCLYCRNFKSGRCWARATFSTEPEIDRDRVKNEVSDIVFGYFDDLDLSVAPAFIKYTGGDDDVAEKLKKLFADYIRESNLVSDMANDLALRLSDEDAGICLDSVGIAEPSEFCCSKFW